MTLARHRRDPPVFEPAPLVAGSVRFVVGVSDGHSPTSGTAAGFSIGTTAGPLSGTPRCNSAPSDAEAENCSRILSANICGSAAAALDFSSFVESLDFYEKLKDLAWGSWEVIAPGRLKSRRGSHSSPRRLSVLMPRSTQHYAGPPKCPTFKPPPIARWGSSVFIRHTTPAGGRRAYVADDDNEIENFSSGEKCPGQL
jgi:hypothetical protein